MHLCSPPQAEDRAGALRHAPLRPGAGRARRAGGPRAAGGPRQHRHPCRRGGAGRRAPSAGAHHRHPSRRMARARRHAGLGGPDRPARRDPRRRPLHLPLRLVPGLGAGSGRGRGAGRAGATPAGILLPRHAPQHRPPDGGRQPGRRALELRHREPPPPPRPLPRPGAAPLPAGPNHPRGDRDRGAVLPRPFRHARRLRLAGHGARRATGARRLHRQPPAPLRRLPGRHGRRRTDPVPRPRLRQPQRRPPPSARLLRGGGGGMARRPRAAERRRGLHPPDPRLARVRPRHLLAHHAGLRDAQRPRRAPPPAMVLLVGRDRDGLPPPGHPADPRPRLRPPHPAADGDGQFRHDRRHRSGAGERVVHGGLRRRLRMGGTPQHPRPGDLRRWRHHRQQALCGLGRLHQPHVRLLPPLPLRPRETTGPEACPFNLLYWDFLARHERRFAGNPRMELPLENMRHMGAAKLAAVREQAAAFLAGLG